MDKNLPTICLINPPSVFLLDERVFVTLGILKVAAVLERAGYAVEMLDFSGIANYEEAMADHARTSKAEIFGITSTTPQMPAAVKIAQAIRRGRPSARLILGGPHITLVQTAWKTETAGNRSGRAVAALKKLYDYFDVLVSGDGEEAVFEAIQKDPRPLIDANDRKSPLYVTSEKLNHLPYPARHLVDMHSYHYSIDGHRATSLIAQLGCPFNCGFCGGRQSPMLRFIRMRSVENILGEMRKIYHDYGTTGFMFYDDELNVNPRMVQLMNGICDLQKELKTDFRLRGFVKSQLFTDQ